MATKPKASGKTTMKAYLKSGQDRREDKANAKVVGMPVDKFKKTKQARSIDRAIVSLDNKKTSSRSKATARKKK